MGSGSGGSAISIHAPHTGRDTGQKRRLPVVSYFNPRAPYGARPTPRPCGSSPPRFQSTRPIRGATISGGQILYVLQFQSTRPIRGATADPATINYAFLHFNPRAPYGARRPLRTLLPIRHKGFQSTRPIRGATTATMTRYPTFFNFNPRAPYGARPCPAGTSGEPAYFNPRAPYGARHDQARKRVHRPGQISIHAPHTGRDSKNA